MHFLPKFSRILLLSSLLFSGTSYAQTSNYDKAYEFYKADEYDSAMHYFNKALIDNSKNYAAYYFSANINFKQGQHALALTDANIVIKNASKTEIPLLSDTYNLRGKIYFYLKDYHKSIAEYSQSIAMRTDKYYLYTNRADAYVKFGNYTAAEADYNKALALNDGAQDAWLGMGTMYLMQKKYVKSEFYFSRLINLSPYHYKAYFLRAKLFEINNRYDEAISDMFESLKLNSYDTKTQEAYLSLALKNIPYAFSNLNAQINEKPNIDVWYIIRAKLFDKTHQYPKAIADFTKAHQNIESDYKYYTYKLRGETYVTLGMYKEALADFNASLVQDSINPYTFGKRADVYRLMGNYTESVKDFSTAIEIEPYMGWFYYRRGWIKDEFLHNPAEGLADYNQAIAIDPDYAYAYLHRGRLYLQQLKDTIKAREDFANILKVDTSEKESGNCSMYALFHLGKIAQSKQRMTKIIQQYPTEGNYYDAACLYALMNDLPTSLKYLTLSLENGYVDFTHLEVDDDLNNLRSFAGYKPLIEYWKTKQEQSMADWKQQFSK